MTVCCNTGGRERIDPELIPQWLTEVSGKTAAGRLWLRALPDLIDELVARWELTLLPAFDREPGPSWVAPVVWADGTDAVLKLTMPHMEADHEIRALRLLDGEPTVRLLAGDEQQQAMLLERCRPGGLLRQRPELEQDMILATLLRSDWRVPDTPEAFRPLAEMVDCWIEECTAKASEWKDPTFVRDCIDLFRQLARDDCEPTLLTTDLHAGNVLSAQRKPWLMIDPKPFVGDRCYDATQHLFNCMDRLHAEPTHTIDRFSALLQVDPRRVRLWLLARIGVEGRVRTDADDRLIRALMAH